MPALNRFTRPKPTNTLPAQDGKPVLARGQYNLTADRPRPVIEKGLPIPPTAHHSTIRSEFGYMLDMEPGDSFLLDDKHYDTEKAAAAVRSFASGHGIRLAIRKVEGGIRVWRRETDEE